MRRALTALLLLLHFSLIAGEAVIDCVEVKTRAPENSLVKVWYRVPQGYDPLQKLRSRVLVLFGGRNCDGKPEVSGKLGWTQWADLNGIFLVAPTLKNDEYWQPEKWSGRAMLDALEQIAAKYLIATSGLLYYGYSAGSQASNLFPAWRPDLCRAYVSHACGLFHSPSLKMKSVAGLVTCGDADTARYVISRNFVEAYRDIGISVVWKSFPNHPHDVPPDSIRLAKEFLAHYHWTYQEDLGVKSSDLKQHRTFVGDDADGVYFPFGSVEAASIIREDRVELPSESVAKAWGRAGVINERVMRDAHVATNVINGVDVVVSVPENVCSDSRILILLGGRGWSGGKSLTELGFQPWATTRGWCIVAPSFSKGEYWRPENGSGEIVQKAVDMQCKKYGIRPLPVFMFGYSAGGQFVSLFQSSGKMKIAAWSVYGCGVYPDMISSPVPALITCGIEDEDRLRISRDFVYRYREAGGLMLWKPVCSGHELNRTTLNLTRLFFDAVATGRPCAVWGEDDVRQVKPKEEIDSEFLNPLYNQEILKLWKKDI